jgi:hypothetical protein
MAEKYIPCCLRCTLRSLVLRVDRDLLSRAHRCETMTDAPLHKPSLNITAEDRAAANKRRAELAPLSVSHPVLERIRSDLDAADAVAARTHGSAPRAPANSREARRQQRQQELADAFSELSTALSTIRSAKAVTTSVTGAFPNQPTLPNDVVFETAVRTADLPNDRSNQTAKHTGKTVLDVVATPMLFGDFKAFGDQTFKDTQFAGKVKYGDVTYAYGGLSSDESSSDEDDASRRTT